MTCCYWKKSNREVGWCVMPLQRQSWLFSNKRTYHHVILQQFGTDYIFFLIIKEWHKILFNQCLCFFLLSSSHVLLFMFLNLPLFWLQSRIHPPLSLPLSCLLSNVLYVLMLPIPCCFIVSHKVLLCICLISFKSCFSVFHA